MLGYATKSHGIEGLWAAIVAWAQEWSDHRVHAERFIEVGERVLVLVLVRQSAVGKRSGVPMNNVDAWGDESSPYTHVELIDVGADTVAAQVSAEVRGIASGASVPWSYWQVVTFRDGKALRIEWFADRAEALKTVGLEE